MALAIGEHQTTKLYHGENEVTKLYRGDKLIYEVTSGLTLPITETMKQTSFPGRQTVQYTTNLWLSYNPVPFVTGVNTTRPVSFTGDTSRFDITTTDASGVPKLIVPTAAGMSGANPGEFRLEPGTYEWSFIDLRIRNYQRDSSGAQFALWASPALRGTSSNRLPTSTSYGDVTLPRLPQNENTRIRSGSASFTLTEATDVAFGVRTSRYMSYFYNSNAPFTITLTRTA